MKTTSCDVFVKQTISIACLFPYMRNTNIVQLCRENSHTLLMLFYLVGDQTATSKHVSGY